MICIAMVQRDDDWFMDRDIWVDRDLQPKVILAQITWVIEASIIHLVQLKHPTIILKKNV